MTCLAANKRPGLLPYPWYVNHLLVGAEEFGISPDYAAALERLPTQPDSDPAREAREMATYS